MQSILALNIPSHPTRARLRHARRNRPRSPRARLSLAIALAALSASAAFFCPVVAHAQFGAPPTTQVHDPSALKPPPGARVAIVEFEDMECPDCAAANPLLKQAAEKYHIPWIRHDFPLPFHNWSFQAAVNARWFDTKSKNLGDDYRDYIFANQPSIETPAQLAQFTQNFRAKPTASRCPSPSIPWASWLPR